jgi:hypothetical protein
MTSVAVILLALALILDLLPVLSAARWDREDRAPPSAIPVVPLLLYCAACAVWQQTAQVRLLGLGVLTVLHVSGLAFVARRRVHWLAGRQKRTPPS